MSALEIRHQISVLKEVAKNYSGQTIDNIIIQLQARDREIARAALKEVAGIDLEKV